MFEQNPVLGPGAGSYTSHSLEILIMLLVAALIGYLLGRASMKKWRVRTHELEAQLAETEKALSNTRAELLACGEARASLERSKANHEMMIDDLELRLDTANKRLAELEPKQPASRQIADMPSPAETVVVHIFDAEQASARFGSRVEQDDLKIVEGIGPKLEEVMHQAGIRTWEQMADTPVDRLVEILNSADERFAMHNPSTWPEQCRLAAAGEWERLRAYQDQLRGGRE